MSHPIDERVVEMRFDNQQFENGVKESLSTLEKLKKALNFSDSAKSFENIDKAANKISLASLSESVDFLQRRFSTFGIVGMRVIENVTDSLMNLANKGISYVSDAIVSGGIKRAMNIENAHFQLQALLKDEKKVQAVMDNAMASVDGTAYAYDEAAKAASQFAASGMEAGEEMLSALTAITGVAAMTNSEYEGISRIFTTVAGNGRLMGDQLLQLSSRGLNAAATIADYFREVKGMSNMTEASIREMVSKGQIDFQTFAAAMDWAFGESAFRANETFNGALSNMRSALARIGAGFFSPLIEQNSDLVLILNTLREKFNEIKKILVFDEQTSALSGLTKNAQIMVESVGDLTKEGQIDFNNFTSALLGTVKTEEDLTKINEKLASSYEKVKENGFASTDTLIEFNKHGINASKAIQDYINGVLEGSIKASDAVKNSIKQITGGTKLISGDVTKLAQDGKISYDIFTSSIIQASGTIGTGSEIAQKAVTSMMNKVKEVGTVSYDSLIEFNKNGINASKAMQDYINGVLDGTIRTTYATKQTIDEITGGTKLISGDIVKLAKEGKITYDILQSSMERAYGDQKNLSKQFTDSVLDTAKTVSNFLKSLDLTKPMEVFTYGVETTKNVFKGLYSVIRPIGKAFADVFLNFSMDDVVDLAEKIEAFTSKLKLSEEASENLHDTFEGLFNVTKLLANAFLGLFGIVLPVGKPVKSLSGLFLQLTGALGRSLTKITTWIKGSKLLNSAYRSIASGIQKAMIALATFISKLDDFAAWVYNLPIVQKSLNGIISLFKKLGTTTASNVSIIVKRLKAFSDRMKTLIPEKVGIMFSTFTKKINEMAENLNHLNITNAGQMFDILRKKIENLSKSIKESEGLQNFIKNIKTFFEDFRDNFSFDNLLENIEKFRKGVGDFVTWVRETLGPSFGEMSVGGVVSTAGGLGLIYAIIQVAKSFDKVSKTISSIPGLIGSIKNTLKAYQDDLKASALIKIAGAIAILGVALTIMSFADTDKILTAALSLSIVAAAILFGASALLNAINKTKTVNDVMYKVAKGFTKTLNNFAKAKKWSSIAKTFKNFAISIAAVVASVIVLAIAYKKDPDALNNALLLVTAIAGVMTGMIVALSGVGQKWGAGMNNFAKVSSGIQALAISLVLVILSLNLLFKLEIPEDADIKIIMLVGMFLGLAVLAGVVGMASNAAGQGSLKSGPILALTVMLLAAVYSIKKIFEIDVSKDYLKHFALLIMLFGGLSLLAVAIGAATQLAGGNTLKMAGTILAMSLFIVTIVGALSILAIFPAKKLFTGAVALGTILVALGAAVAISTSGGGKDNWKSILAMAIAVGAVTFALGVLSMVRWTDLLKGAVALGIVLTTMSLAFGNISTITDKSSWVNMALMMAMIAEIAVSLSILSGQPWKSLIAGAVGLSLVMAAMTGVYALMSKIKVNGSAIAAMILGSAAIAMLAVGLLILADKPWQGILAATAAISLVMAAMGVTFAILSNIHFNLTAAISFIGGMIAIALIGSILGKLASQPWEGMSSVAKAICTVLIGLAVTMAICALVGNFALGALAGIVILDLFIVNLIWLFSKIGEAMNQIEGLEESFNKGGEILARFGTFLGEFIGNLVAAVMENVMASLPTIGTNLSDFMTNAQAFFSGLDQISEDTLVKAGFLSAIILLFTVADFLTGIANFITKGSNLPQIGLHLSQFMINAMPFFLGISIIGENTVEAAKRVAELLLLFTAADLISGITSWISGGSNLSDFADQLKDFGPSIVEFAETVKDVDPKAVEGAASAAKIMAGVSKELYGTGGLIQAILGEKNLSDFADQLKDFGPSIVEFAETVKDVDPESVKGAAQAAEIMATMADKLPNSGGLAAKIFGDNTLSQFGEELKEFAPKIVKFAEKVKDVDPKAVTGVAYITAIMSNLAEHLPNSEGVISWFTGDNTLSDFGLMLDSFGDSFNSFYGKIVGIEYSSVTEIIDCIIKLADLAKDSKGIKADSLKKLGETLKKAGDLGVSGFCEAFTNSETDVTNATTTMVNYVYSALNNLYTNMLSIGKSAAQGLINGLNSKSEEVSTAAKNLGEAADIALKAVLKIKSPSRKLAETGRYAALGFIGGLLSCVAKAVKTGEELGDETSSAISSSISKVRNLAEIDLNLNPVIRPVVDLDNVERSVNTIHGMFDQNIQLGRFNNVIGNQGQMASSISLGSVRRTEDTMAEMAQKFTKLNSDLIEDLQKAIDEFDEIPVQVNVYLEGDAKGIFKVVRAENDRFVKASRYNPLSQQRIKQSDRQEKG